MAIEFGSRRETFENYKVYETMLAGRPFKVEMGKMCGLSNASALIRYGETCVMCNVVMSPKPREGVAVPQTVEVPACLFAVYKWQRLQLIAAVNRNAAVSANAHQRGRRPMRPVKYLDKPRLWNDVCIKNNGN